MPAIIAKEYLKEGMNGNLKETDPRGILSCWMGGVFQGRRGKMLANSRTGHGTSWTLNVSLSPLYWKGCPSGIPDP